MTKLVKLFIIFGPVKGNHVKVIRKYSNPGQEIDESLMSTLCLPKIEVVHQPKKPKFQTFLVTKQDGRVLYGSGLIVYDESTASIGKQYVSNCLVIITETPFIHATKSLLHLIWNERCDDQIVKSIMNIPLPPKRVCLCLTTTNKIGDIHLYRGLADLPMFDYPLRELFTFLQIDDLLLAFTCILMEFKTLIISRDNYKLMIVGETLTTLLLPLKWSNVYVPILPPDCGATYLDAPTSFIMGINTQVTELPDNLNHIQCKINCDEGLVVCDADSLALPLFLNDIKKQIIKIIDEFQKIHQTKPFTYLDDLKFNRAIRVLFIKTIRKNILSNYERYIMDVPETSSELRQFDVVSYLIDQPKFMQSFLSKFLDTQLFASFIDENAKRMQQSRLSIFDMDSEELSEHFSDESFELAFKNAKKIKFKNLKTEQHELELKTPLRHRTPVVVRNSADPESTSLINQVKNLTKEILVETMGTDDIINSTPRRKFSRYIDGSDPDGALIGKLCDLIERVWSHGAFVSTQDNSAACCPLWNHLMTFARLKFLDSNPIKREFSDGSHLDVLSSPNYKLDKTSELDKMVAQSANLFKTFNPFKSRSRFEQIGPMARDLINDLINIIRIEEVKTSVGKARSFIRLSLERKKLSKHLKTLLGDQALLSSLYKPYAFLLHEEEREQFLMYLLTLNAVDLPCFTSTLVHVVNERRLKPGRS